MTFLDAGELSSYLQYHDDEHSETNEESSVAIHVLNSSLSWLANNDEFLGNDTVENKSPTENCLEHKVPEGSSTYGHVNKSGCIEENEFPIMNEHEMDYSDSESSTASVPVDPMVTLKNLNMTIHVVQQP